jgi:hypothetical protein
MFVNKNFLGEIKFINKGRQNKIKKLISFFCKLAKLQRLQLLILSFFEMIIGEFSSTNKVEENC